LEADRVEALCKLFQKDLDITEEFTGCHIKDCNGETMDIE